MLGHVNEITLEAFRNEHATSLLLQLGDRLRQDGGVASNGETALVGVFNACGAEAGRDRGQVFEVHVGRCRALKLQGAQERALDV